MECLMLEPHAFDGGVARFASVVRGVDEAGHDMLEVQLDGQPKFYGEYRNRWAADGNSYDIEIVSFGYRNRDDAGLPEARGKFNSSEKIVIERLIRSLVALPHAREGLAVFNGGQFMGNVMFAQDWIVLAGC
jgi:hypothetical protein